jgi:3-phenylpropionate/trans-cinnamate dioxygenase ferredoxin component
MADFTEVMKTGDLTDGMMKRVVLGEQDIIIARVEGKFYAAQGRCPHMRAYLSRGKLNGTVVTCPLHGSRFDLKNGKVVRWVTGKGIMSTMGKLMSMLGIAAKSEKPLAVYEIKVDGERVMVKLP